MAQNAILCRVGLTSSPAPLPRFVDFMTITPIICMCAMTKFWVQFKRQFSIATPKPPILHIIANKTGIDPIDAATIGDGANDLAMLQAAGMGVAFEGKPLLLAEVAIQLNHTDLRGLLYLQGYKDRDFITDKI
jgi:magnesium-transporting ATPase (P-type)